MLKIGSVSQVFFHSSKKVKFLPGVVNGRHPFQGYTVVADVPLVNGHEIQLSLVRDHQVEVIDLVSDSSDSDDNIDDNDRGNDTSSVSSNDDNEQQDGRDGRVVVWSEEGVVEEV